MDFASSLTELVNNVWGLVGKPLGYICNLRDNVNSLQNATEELKAKSRDVKTRVEHEERGGGVQRTNEVARWLGDVQVFEGRVDQVLREAEERDRIRCPSRCIPRNCWLSYRLGKTVDKMLKEARDLQKKKGESDDLMLPLPPPPVIGMPMDETVGLDSSLDEVWKWLVDEKQGGVIGLCGLGGVGKTTLMKKINEKIYRENPGFEVVIWVVVSRQVSKEAIRDVMRKRLGIGDQIWNSSSLEEKVYHLCKALTQKKFVLLIDDLWERLDLPEIGVRHGLKNGSKIVFSTREKQICAQMRANKIFEVQCLTPEEALELFERNAGESTIKSHPKIQELANKIADECKGLPLALVTVGRAMAGIANPQEWEQALATLRKNPYKLSGMEEEVYHILEFSYNRLDCSNLQRCFLYCCLFPEDYHIRSDHLIRLWIGEGLLGDTDDVYGLRIEGERVLGRLNRACLLESASGHDDANDDGVYVKMHDVIRDMATWIARDHGQKENKWLVIEREEDLSAKMISKWGDAEKVSLWGEWIRKINQIPPICSQLETLIAGRTQVSTVPRGFFNSMAAPLTVLDLSFNVYIKSLPEDICNLINLQFLNLSGTCIKELPGDIHKLIHLRWLLLDSIEGSILIPMGAITILPLNVLSMWDSWSKKEEEMVEELGLTQHLTDLSIRVCKPSSAEKIFQTLNLQRSIKRMKIMNCLGLTRIVVSHSLLHLESLILNNCHKLVQIEINDGIGRVPTCSCFPSLTKVTIYRCKFSDLSWLMYTPKLQKLTVQSCLSMEKIIENGVTSEKLAALRVFSHLEYIELCDLPKLTSICNEALSFPEGVGFKIYNCHGLKKLPLDSNSARGGGFSVEADQYWWAGFEWDPAARVTHAWNESSRDEETTYEEARRRLKGRYGGNAMTFLPRGPS